MVINKIIKMIDTMQNGGMHWVQENISICTIKNMVQKINLS